MSVAPEPLEPGDDDATTLVERLDIVPSTNMQPTIKLEAEKYMPIDDAEVKDDGEPPVPTHGAKRVKAAAACPHHGRNASLIPGQCVGECG